MIHSQLVPEHRCHTKFYSFFGSYTKCIYTTNWIDIFIMEQTVFRKYFYYTIKISQERKCSYQCLKAQSVDSFLLDNNLPLSSLPIGMSLHFSLNALAWKLSFQRHFNRMIDVFENRTTQVVFFVNVSIAKSIRSS